MQREKISFPVQIQDPSKIKYIRYCREAGGLGDSLRFLGAGQGLKKKYPSARVHYYGASYLETLISLRAPAAFDLFVPCDHGTRDRDDIPDESRHRHLMTNIKYDITVDGWCPPYLHEPATEGICCRDRVELWCQEAGVDFCRPELLPTIRDVAAREKILGRTKKYSAVVGIQPGATCRSREWPYNYWDQLIKLFAQENILVILFDVCWRWLQAIDPKQKNLEPSINLSWTETIGRILATDLMITPDSGFYHLSGCLKKKCLGIFGCTSGQIISRPWKFEKKTGHYIQLRHSEIDYDQLPKENGCGRPCKPICYMRWERGWDAGRYRTERKYCSLMQQITPEMVLARSMALLGK